MDMQLVWNKIAQLEKVLSLQSKKIEDLEMIIKKNNLVVGNELGDSCNRTAGHRSMGPFLLTNNDTTNSANIVNLTTTRQSNITSTVIRNSSVPAFQPYLMSPHVHPSSAIPPFGTKPARNPPPPPPTHAGPLGGLPIYGDSNSLKQAHPNSTSRSTRLTKVSRTSTALNRHSVHGTHLDKDAFNLESDEESANDSHDNDIRHNRQSFVEPSSGEGESSPDNSSDDDRQSQDAEFVDCHDNDTGEETEIEADQEKPVDCRKLKGEQHDHEDDIKFVSYTEPSDLKNSDLDQYLVGRVIEKDMLPKWDENTVNDPPYVIYNFRKIEQSPKRKRKDKEVFDWPWPSQKEKPVLPEKLQRILKNSPFQ